MLDDPLSMWGGLDPADGHIIDVHHPQVGSVVTGCVLLMPTGRGSCSSSYVLAESIRSGTGPAAIVLLEADPIVVLGALVADELYGRAVPVVVADADTYSRLLPGREVRVVANADGASITWG